MLKNDSKRSSTPLLTKKKTRRNKNDSIDLKFWFIIPLVCIVALIYIGWHGGLSPTPLVQTPRSYIDINTNIEIEEPSVEDLSHFMKTHEHQTITVPYNSYEMIEAIGHAEPGSSEWIEFHSSLLANAGYDFDEVMNDPDITVRFEAHDNNHMEFEDPVIVETRQPKHGHMITEAARYRSLTINKHSISGGPGLVEIPNEQEMKSEDEEEEKQEDEALEDEKKHDEQIPVVPTDAPDPDPINDKPTGTDKPTDVSTTKDGDSDGGDSGKDNDPETTQGFKTIPPESEPQKSTKAPKETKPPKTMRPTNPEKTKAPKTPRPAKPTNPPKAPKTPRPAKPTNPPRTAKPTNPKPTKEPKTTRAPKDTKAPKTMRPTNPKPSKAPKPTKTPQKYKYKPPRVKPCPPPGPHGVIPGRPDCYDEWVDPGLHCFNAVTYRKPSDVPGQQWLAVDCGSVPGTVRTGCTSNNGNTGYPVYGTGTTYDPDTGYQGCVTTLGVGDRDPNFGDVWVFLSARCCWPTDTDGKWEANDVDLTVTVLGKAVEDDTEGQCIMDSCADVAQTKAGHTVTSDCSANQGVAGEDGVISVSDTFVSPKLVGNTCQAVRYDAGLIDLETMCMTYNRIDDNYGQLECVTHDVGQFSVGLGSFYLECPDNGSGEGSNWKMIGCNANIEGSPSKDDCLNNPFETGKQHSWGFSSQIDGVGLYKTPYFSGEACRGAGNNNSGQSMSAKCCRIKKDKSS